MKQQVPPTKLVFFDLETAGLKNDPSIIQIAAIAIDEELKELESFEVKVQFDAKAGDSKSLDMNCFEPRVWKRFARPADEAALLFGDFLRRHATIRRISKKTRKSYHVAQLVAHNGVSFDGPLLRAWYRKLNLFLPASSRVMCTLDRAQWFFFEQQSENLPANFQLRTLCDYFGISLSKDEAHDAMHDVRATVELYRAMDKASYEAIPPLNPSAQATQKLTSTPDL